MLQVDIVLTELGERNYGKVLEMLYSYINKIKKEEVQEFVFREMQKKSQIDFDYKTKTTALGYAQNLARRLMRVKEEDINDTLWIPHAYEIFDKQEIRRRLDMLVPENSYTIFLSKIVANDQEVEFKKEKYYGTPYTIEKIDEETIIKLKQILPDAETKLGYPP